MSNKTFLSKLLTSLGVKDADTAADVIEQMNNQKPTTDAANPIEQRIAAIETGFTEIKALLTKQTTDKAKEDADAATATAAAAAAAASKPTFTADALKEVVARAEILSPGIQIPTNDSLKDVEGVEQFMRASIEKASATDAGKETIKTFLSNRELKTLTGDALIGVFNGAAEVTRVRNNTKAAPNPFDTKGNPFVGQTKDGKTLTTADQVREQQKANVDFWSKQKAS